MQFHGVDVAKRFKRMRELAPEAYRAFLRLWREDPRFAEQVRLRLAGLEQQVR